MRGGRSHLSVRRRIGSGASTSQGAHWQAPIWRVASQSFMNCQHVNFQMNRRDFFGRFALGMGGMALFSLLNRDLFAASPAVNPFQGILERPHFTPKAKRIIYLFMSGGPSQHDLFDYKPLLNQKNGEDLPESVRMGQRLTGMSGNQAQIGRAH